MLDNMGNTNKKEGFRVRSNNKSWTLVAGALLILAACVLAYVLTKPAEADVSMILDLQTRSSNSVA